MKQKPIIKNAFEALKRLPSQLRYHGSEHTEDVLHEVILFAYEDALDERSIELLAVSAAYHDTGFIDSVKENEALGAENAVRAMQGTGEYSEIEIALVKQMILDTQLRFTPDGPRQVPTSTLAQYLCDADVSNLGRDDFFKKAELVRQELGAPVGRPYFSNLLQFLSSHIWYTPAASKLRQTKKAQNLSELKKLL